MSQLESIIQWTHEQMEKADSGHDFAHVQRVVQNASKLSSVESADLEIVLPAAWMHDCVFVPKNSPDRSRASWLAAEKAAKFLRDLQFSDNAIEAIHHCIHSHSFSANVPCKSIEAKVVQDADRIEAVGAIGLARCLMTGGAMNQRLYHPTDPFPSNRSYEDHIQSVDHFFAKLLNLHHTMQTTAGRKLAQERTDYLKSFLFQLANELGVETDLVTLAVAQSTVRMKK